MDRFIKVLFIPVLSVLILNACSSDSQEMQKFDSQANVCEPVQEIIDFSSKKSVNRLVIPIRDSNNQITDYKGVVTWLVQQVTEVVKDASLKIYLKVALNLDFRFLVAMMMTLSVILFAASVLLGMTQANGYNALMFVLKLVVIYHLTINYFYFYTYVIQSFEALVTDTMMFSSMTFSDYLAVDPTIICLGLFGQACDIAGIVGTLFFGGSNVLTDFISNLFGGQNAINKFFLFNAFDDTISYFFDVRQWKLVLALFGTGMVGVFWAVMVILMQVLYLMAVIGALKVYLLAYIARWALYGLGPIFISFALFRQTKSLFDGWLQQLISFTLQPVLLFIFLGMFQTLINGFISQIYITVASSNNTYTIYEKVPYGYDYTLHMWTYGNSSSPDLEYVACDPAADPECGDITGNNPNTKPMIKKQANARPACIKWTQLPGDNTGGEKLYWYRLCQQVGTGDDCMTSLTKPIIPIDIWMVMSVIVICYLMFFMCGWVTDVANSLAGGAMSLAGTRIMGWDSLKQGVSKGAGSMFQGAFRGGGGPTATRDK